MMGKFKMMDKRESWIRQLTVDRYKRFNELTKIKSTKIIDNEADDTKKKRSLLKQKKRRMNTQWTELAAHIEHRIKRN